MPLGNLARRPTVLIVLHQEHSTPGRIGIALKAMEVRLDIRRRICGEPLPDRLADHDGVVVFGGPMSANDTLDWVRRVDQVARNSARRGQTVAWPLPWRTDAGASARREGVQLRRQA
jgi:GMP synthase-like glutamine amidotransferase